MRQETFEIKGMMCNGCVTAVENGLKVTKGVQSVQAHLESSKVTITYNEEQTTPIALQNVVKGLGYELILQ